MLTECLQVSTTSPRERIGDFDYFTHVSEDRPEDHFLRVDLKRAKMQSVLDINDIVEQYNQQLEISQVNTKPRV